MRELSTYQNLVERLAAELSTLAPKIESAIKARKCTSDEGWWELAGYDKILKEAVDRILKHRRRLENAIEAAKSERRKGE